MKTTYALLVAGLASQQVAATWNFFDNYGTPNYSDNKCSDKQQGGFDWSDLNDGDSVGNYGDFDFSGGWKCSNSFGKRDVLTKRTFKSKCIKNTVSKQKPASFGCSKRGFSISHMDISAEFDAELELHYTMQDGSICKQRGSCSAGGSTLKNTQCGGAKSVQVYLGSHYQGSKESCEIGFHNIGFDCSPETPYTPPTPPKAPSTTSMVQYPSSPAEKPSTPANECGQYGGKDCNSKPVQTPTGGSCEGKDCYATSTPEASTSAVKTPTGGSCEGGNCYATSTPEGSTSPVEKPTSSAPQVPVSSQAPYTNTTAPIYSPPEIPSSVVKSSTVTPQPETSSAVVPPTVESSAAPGCGYGQSCGQSSAVDSSVVPSSTGTPLPATSSPAPQPSSPSYPPADVTDSVPKCMNSWLQISAPGCKDNTDSKCYCVKPEFTKNVIDCLTARCGNDDETRKALQYFIGICAEHIPQNPQIVGDCPSYIPLNPTPAAPTGGASVPVPASSAPAAAESSYVAVPPGGGASAPPTITIPVPAPPAEQTPCTTITYGTTTLTVPQVHFTTSPNTPGATPTQPVALVPGTAPAETPAATTTAPAGGVGAPYPTPTTMGTATVPFGSGTGAIRPSSPAQFTGAASPLSAVPKGAMFGAVLALFAL
ncbi:hypothetical protein yc1106_01010 [Curvularia clavata]|uniref:CFEM domain-containing protein n=1 Tax=Curvularia clavata TaxID=95742 RepID=A0A9Q8Z0E4_CURCL|nr:hypothetical protein yc1106_01010 [Curvularia clavata]